MRTTRFLARRPMARLVAATAAAGTASLLLVGVLQVPAGAVTGGPYNTSVVVSSAPLAAYSGQSVTFSAKVGSSGHGTPSGSMTFSIVGSDASVVNCDAGNVVPFTGGVATCVVVGGLAAGGSTFTVTAAYSDTADSTYNPSTGTKTATIKQGKSTTAVTSSANPSVTGQAVSFNAAVAAVAPAIGTPSGSVTFAGVSCDGGNTITLSGGLAQCVISGGLASQMTPILVTGAYSGDPQFLTSTGNVKQTVGKAGGTVALTANPNNCVGDICTIGQGTPVSFTGTATTKGTDGGTGTPTGSLAFSVIQAGSKTSLTCDGGSNTVALVAGQATCNFSGGLSASVYFTVTATLVSTGYAAASATLYENSALAGTNTTTDALHALGAGQSFTVTARVTTVGYTGSNTPSGFVNVLVCGSNSNGYNGCQGGAAPVGAGGVAQFLVGGGEYPGGYSVTAIYTGDANFYSSTSHLRNFFIGKSTTTLTLSQYGGFVTVSGDAATITATVVAPNGAAGSVLIGPMSGNITFTITDSLGTPVTCVGGNSVALAIDLGQVEGTATCFLAPGSVTTASPSGSLYTIQANYGGDSNYVVSNAQVKLAVVPPIA